MSPKIRDFAVEVFCHSCGRKVEIKVDERDFYDWSKGELIQKAMPYLTPDERELLISQTCGECFAEMFAEDEEDEQVEITKYGILDKKKNKLVSFRYESNEGSEFCDATACLIGDNDDRVWLVDTEKEATNALVNPSAWYNAGHSCPGHDSGFNPKEHPERYEVVKVMMVVIPTSSNNPS
jgi:hypothetical protein